MKHVRIRQMSKEKWETNPISGHSWRNDKLLEKYEIVGKYGVVDSCKSYEKALKIAAEWENFYEKFDQF